MTKPKEAYDQRILEYVALLGQVQKPDIPLWAKRRMLDTLERLAPGMTEDDFRRFQEISRVTRATLQPYLHPVDDRPGDRI